MAPDVRFKDPFNDVRGLVAHAKAHPGKLTFGSGGTGGIQHLSVEVVKQRAGIDMLHVPYKGSAPAQQDVIGGRVPLLFDVMFSAMPFGSKMMAV